MAAAQRYWDKKKSVFFDSPIPETGMPTPTDIPAPTNSFNFTLGGDFKDQLSLGNKKPTNATQLFNRNASITSSPASNGGQDWRFAAFGKSQLGGGVSRPITGSGSTYETSPDAYKTNPAAYKTNPAAYGQVVSKPSPVSPVIPPDYQPRDVSEEQKMYGWGSADEEED